MAAAASALRTPPPDFERLALQYGRALYQRARALTGGHPDAWDLVQDTFERALRRPPEVASDDELRRWLFVAMHRLYVDRFRMTKRRRHVPLNEDTLPFVPECVHPVKSAWQLVDWNDVRGCVAKLERRLREPYEMQVDGFPLADIARHLDLPIATVGTRVHRARRRLRKIITAALHENELSPSATDASSLRASAQTEMMTIESIEPLAHGARLRASFSE